MAVNEVKCIWYAPHDIRLCYVTKTTNLAQKVIPIYKNKMTAVSSAYHKSVAIVTWFVMKIQWTKK